MLSLPHRNLTYLTQMELPQLPVQCLIRLGFRLLFYFSAVGSHSIYGEIIKYEWDLDGNGVIDTDSSHDNGYAQFTYQKPGEYSLTLQVTDSSGRTARDTIIVRVRHPGSSSVDYWSVLMIRTRVELRSN